MNFADALRIYSVRPTEEKLNKLTENLLQQMTIKEKIDMIKGHALKVTVINFLSNGRFYNAEPYGAGGCKRLGIPEVLFCDGPRGVVLGHSTCFPVSMLRGASFDDDLEYEIGEVIAKEALAGGANYFAGICINLLRHPMWGRAQETYGEDPYLLGRMGVALTKAVQEKGMMACPKHYALNSIEDLRFSVDAQADERTLHEVYLPHFKKCIDAGALSIMAAYNKVNGEYCCENKTLLIDILRDMWGFKGFTISDFFFGIYNGPRAVKAGLDIEMPYTFRYAFLNKQFYKGLFLESDLDRGVRGIIRALLISQSKIQKYPKSVIMCDEHTKLSRKAATKGMVLLKNENKTLPFAQGVKIAVIGRYANEINVGDHGSSNVYSTYTVTPYKGFCNRFGSDNVVLYNGCEIEKAVAAAENCDYIFLCVGSDYKQEGEFLVNLGDVKKKPAGSGGDRASLRIPPEDVALIEALGNTGKKLVVNIMGGSAYVINEWKDKADAILMSFYCGLEGGNALADIVSGDVCPSGRLPFTIAKDENDYPPFLHIGDKTKEIEYGYYHGYTLFDKKGVEPEYPFGFGLSYTSFALECVGVAKDDDKANVTVNVSNTGACDGEETVQIYVSSDGAESDRPVKLLKGFKKVPLKAGEKKQVTVEVEYDDIKFFNPETKAWELDDSYTVYAASDSKCTIEAGKLVFVEKSPVTDSEKSKGKRSKK